MSRVLMTLVLLAALAAAGLWLDVRAADDTAKTAAMAVLICEG